jgi:hypothetical protein
LILCISPYAYVLPNFKCWNLITNMTILIEEVLWELIGSWGICPYKRCPESSLPSQDNYEQEIGLPQTSICHYLFLDFAAFRIMRNELLLFLSHPVYVFCYSSLCRLGQPTIKQTLWITGSCLFCFLLSCQLLIECTNKLQIFRNRIVSCVPQTHFATEIMSFYKTYFGELLLYWILSPRAISMTGDNSDLKHLHRMPISVLHNVIALNQDNGLLK